MRIAKSVLRKAALKVTLLFAVLHARLTSFIIGTATAFCEAGGSYFFDNVCDGGRRRTPYAGAGHVADGAAANQFGEGHFFRFFRYEIAVRQ